MKIVARIITYWLVFIIVFNTRLYLLLSIPSQPINKLNAKGMIISIPVINKAYVFAHGNYDRTNNSTIIEHMTTRHYTSISTKQFIDDLLGQGYEEIWLSQCQTGNSDYIWYNITNGEKVYWKDYPMVSRNTNPGSTIPVFLGFGFKRLTIN